MCHILIPDPTRFADPNRVRGARPYTGTLDLIFFFKAELVPVGYGPTSYNKIKISYTYLITYTDTHAFILNHDKHIIETNIKIFMNSYNP